MRLLQTRKPDNYDEQILKMLRSFFICRNASDKRICSAVD
ncbi:MAG: hypothetical protein JWN60_1492 [Acidobacteria bacterium]|nr:hypothetical protein [Acidobacteriota bacterium]